MLSVLFADFCHGSPESQFVKKKTVLSAFEGEWQHATQYICVVTFDPGFVYEGMNAIFRFTQSSPL